MTGLHYQQVDSVLMADFLLVENTLDGYEISNIISVLQINKKDILLQKRDIP